MSIGNKGSLKREDLKPESLRKVSSPGRLASSKAEKPSAVSAIGTTVDISAAALSTADTYTDAAVNAELDSLMGEVESRLDVLEAKMDELLAALK